MTPTVCLQNKIAVVQMAAKTRLMAMSLIFATDLLSALHSLFNGTFNCQNWGLSGAHSAQTICPIKTHAQMAHPWEVD